MTDPGMNSGRSERFERSAELERVLREVNDELAGRTTAWDRKPSRPVVLVVGAPRTGTTLLLQVVSRLGWFWVPTNLAARFYGHPGLGIRMQQILLDLDAGDQIGLRGQVASTFEAALGRTRGAAEPSEFWYWWRRFYAFTDVQRMSPEQFRQKDHARFLHELDEMIEAAGRPLLMKGMHMNWHLRDLARLSPEFVFVHMRRADAEVARSLLQARRSFFGDPQRWWSHKPPEYAWLRERPPAEQVAGQAVFTDLAVAHALKPFADRSLSIDYHDFCADPLGAVCNIARLAGLDPGLETATGTIGPFEPRRQARASGDSDFEAIDEACRRFRALAEQRGYPNVEGAMAGGER